MPLLSTQKLSLAYGIQPILDAVDFQIERGERVGLLGRNGEGKSSFLKVLNGDVAADSGELIRRDGLKIARLEQAPSLSGDDSVYATVARGLGEIGTHLADYHRFSQQADTLPETLAGLHQKIDAEDGWRFSSRIDKVISHLELDADASASELSGGWQRRVALAQALVIEPDVLLLDEPTNHLDIAAIEWLENQLKQFPGAIIFITHDRAFLQALATRIVDLDRGQLVSWPGTYRDYLRRKAAALEEEARHRATFDKKLAQEEAWIRQGIKARRTRNEGRVRALKKMRDERAKRRNVSGKAKLTLEQATSSGKKVIEAKNLSLALGGKTLIHDFSTTILRGDRIGLIGANGAGKSSLIKVLLGELVPGSGEVTLGTQLEIAHFDQLRGQLDEQKTVAEFIGEGREQIDIGGKQRHVMSYLADFLFAPTRARSPIGSLSGGEKARVLLAWLFSRPVNFLVLDEPTNDLDIETLELLEELLLAFSGTLLLVSHDRRFMDNVVTSTLVFEGDGVIGEYVGGYSDWVAKATMTSSFDDKANQPPSAGNSPAKVANNGLGQTAQKQKKLSYKLQRELDALPEKIEQLETEQARLTDIISDPTIYQTQPEKAADTNRQLKQIEDELNDCYVRWTELESA